MAKTAGGATTHYLYDLGGNLIAEHDGATGAPQAEYAGLQGMKLAHIQGGMVYWVHGDQLDTPQRLTDAAKAVVWDASYAPFGEATVTGALTFNQRFPGQYYDAETGLHYNYFRDYDASLGRYVQSDPIGLQGGWNTYGYVSGNPVMRVDSKGLVAPAIPIVVGLVEAAEFAVGYCAGLIIGTSVVDAMSKPTSDVKACAANDNDCPSAPDDDDIDCQEWLEDLQAWAYLIAVEMDAGKDMTLAIRQYNQSVALFCEYCPELCGRAPIVE